VAWSGFFLLTAASQIWSRLQRPLQPIKQRTGLIWAVLLATLFVVFLLREQREVFQIFHVLRNANPLWLIAALGIGLLIQALMGLTLSPILRRLGNGVPGTLLVRIQLQRHVISTLMPLGGPASTYAMVRGLNQQDVSSDDALYASVLNGVLGYVSFVLFLAPVLVYLLVGGGASTLILFASAALALIVVAMLTALVAAHRAPSGWRALERRMPRRISRFVEGARAHQIGARDLFWPIVIHLAIEVLGVWMLYACLEAVHAEPSVRDVLTGYAVGTLFLLITPVFQGLGAVELSMTVALRGLGIASSAALAAVLLYRVAEVWGPLLVGLSVHVSDVKEVRRASAHVPAIITGITGFLTVLAAMSHPFPRRFDRLEQYSVIGPHEFTRTFTVVAGFFLIFLSWSLWRRKRVAWIAALVILLASTVGPFIKGHDHVLFVLSMVNVTLLILHRKHFRVRSDVPTMRQGVIRLCLSLTFAVVYGTLGFFLIDERAFGTDFGLWQAIVETLRLFFSLGMHGATPHTRFGSWFVDSLTFVGIVSVAYATFSLVRPVIWRRRTLPSDRRLAAEMIDRWGDSSLDFFKTWNDKYFFFSSNRQGVISFGQARSSAIALGDPVASDPHEFERVLAEFLDYCDANDWGVAFHQVPSTHLDQYASAGLSAVKIGEEAVVDVTSFTLQGRAVKALRSSVNRLEREGYRSILLYPPLSDEQVSRLRAVSDEWLELSGRRERWFTLGQFTDEYLRAFPVMGIEDSLGNLLAFANIIPDGAKGEATIDLMRRRPNVPNGIMDLLQVRLIEHFRDVGFERYSLGMAPFYKVGDQPDAPVIERAIRLLYDHVSRVFSYKGLHDYKAKFSPTWEPRYLVFSSETALPAITLALIALTERPATQQTSPETSAQRGRVASLV
jgi:phosphatidylglycerol lysyltransferase